MHSASVLFLISLLVFGINGLEVTTSAPIHNKTIKVSLFYESYCPFSVTFVVEELFPTMIRYHNYMTMDLVPFGHAKSTKTPDGHWDFTCQHGAKECYGNRVHACVIQQGMQKDQLKTIMALACLMHFSYVDSEVQQCLAKSNLEWIKHRKCMENESEKLELEYGNRTQTNVPKITFVPFLMFDDKFDEKVEQLALSNLEHVICDLLGDGKPDTCPDFNILW